MKTKKIVFGITLGILIFNLNIFMLTTTQSLQESKPTVTLNRIMHDPFIITHDDNFTTFPGTGTPSDPYVIEDYEIMTAESYAIYINGTTKNFVIRNCYVESIASAIYISHASSNTAKVEHNVCSNSGDGIKIFNTPEVIVCDNTISNVNTYSIAIVNSNSSVVEKNICSSTTNGIGILESGGTHVFNNTVLNSLTTSLNVIGSDYCLVQNNSFSNSLYVHIYISDNSRYNTFQFNIIYNCTKHCGIEIYGDNNILSYNLVQLCESGIIGKTFSENNVLHHNTFTDNEEEVVEMSQVVDDGEGNVWYDTVASEGNYWSDWDGEGAYEITGEANSTDPYPLSEPTIPPIGYEEASFPFMILLPILIILTIFIRKPKKSNIKQ